MAFDSIATDDDRNFQQDAAIASRGLRIMDPSLGLFDQAKVADATRPAMMQLSQMLDMRGRANAMDQRSREFIRKEDDIGKSHDDFDGFSKEIQGLNGVADPVQKAQKMADMQSQHPEWLLNKDIQTSMKSLSDANSAISEAASNKVRLHESTKAEDKLQRQDVIDNQLKDHQDAAAIEQYWVNDTMRKSENNRFLAGRDASIADRKDKHFAAVSQSSLPPEVADIGIELGTILGDNERFAGDLGAVTSILNETNEAIHIESAYNPFLSKFKGLEQSLKASKVDPMKLFSPDREVAGAESSKAMNALGNDPNARRDFQEYYNIQSQKILATQNREKMMTYLAGEIDPSTGQRKGGALRQLADAAKDGINNGGEMDNNKMLNFRLIRDKISAMVTPISAGNKKIIASNDAFTKHKEDDQKLRKMDMEIKNSQSLIDSRTANVNYTNMRSMMIKNNMDGKDAEIAFNALVRSGQIKVKSDPKEAAIQLATFRQNLQSEFAKSDAANPYQPSQFDAPQQQ